MSYSITDRTIAIAGIYQAAALVQQIAKTGTLDEKPFETCIKSIFYINVDKPEDVFEGAGNLEIGLNTLISQLGGNSEQITVQKDMHVTKYAIGAMILEKKLHKNQSMLNEISSGIDLAKIQSEHFTITHENVIANLADLYSKTISTLHPRIMVQGEHMYISNPGHANKIRALLLSAIRAVVLWRQCGGTRWQLILQRKNIINTAGMLLDNSS
jgi:high frequency lysogenization protein